MDLFSGFVDRENVEDYQFYREPNARIYQRNFDFRGDVDLDVDVDDIDSIISDYQQNGLDVVDITEDDIADDDIINELSKIIDEDNEIASDPSVSSNNILPSPIDRLTGADLLYQQISEQIHKIRNATVSNDDRTERVQMTIANDPLWLEVANATPDGSCMFGSFVHQLFGYKIRSDAQVQAVRQLRRDVVQYISEHFSEFQHVLLDGVLHENSLSQTEDTDRACRIFLNEYLPRNNVWGGQETIAAVQKMYRVNILVFREPDSYSYFHLFDEPNTRILLLAYRLGNRLNRLSHNHYDSVCNIEADEIRSLAYKLSTNQYM